ncbi:MAG: hypothetical protein ABEN55_09950 [Bradymonadaceae bacterium]
MDRTAETHGRVAVLAAVAAVAATLLVAPIRSAIAQEGDGDDLPETPIEYERWALKQNPQLQTLYQRWQAARSEAKAEASNWPQPKVGYRTFIDGWWLEDAGLRHRDYPPLPGPGPEGRLPGPRGADRHRPDR